LIQHQKVSGTNVNFPINVYGLLGITIFVRWGSNLHGLCLLNLTSFWIGAVIFTTSDMSDITWLLNKA